jgi:hypothetical protein
MPQTPPNTSSLAASGPAAESNFSADITSEGLALCPFRDAETWIEIELYDHEGKPCADEPYTITLPDGSVLDKQRLDAKGRARHQSIPVGDCLVEFPERELLRPDDNPKDAFEIVLLDEHGKPAADEPYLIVLSDGTRCEGKLDKQGKLRMIGVAPEFFRIYFPERPGYRWESR